MKRENPLLRVGITVGLRAPRESLWINGIKQNAIYLMEALRHCPSVASVMLVNTTEVDPSQVAWDTARWPVFGFAQAKDRLDLLIELGGQVSAEQTAYLKERGVHLVSYCCGSEYVSAMEAMMFRRPQWTEGLFVNPRYDAVWVIPQVAGTSLHFFRTLRRCEASIAPFVWDPVLLMERARGLENVGEYRPRLSRPARLSVLEPNVDVVKFCLYPVLIAEECFRKRPCDIERLQVTNAVGLAQESTDFVALMNQLDIVRGHKAVFTDRRETPAFLAEETDVVISHQWGNPLNYLYLEVCWQGYPLVHNAALCTDLGYFYQGNDVQSGADKLEAALDHHDSDHRRYKARQREAIARFLPGDMVLTGRYESLIAQVRSMSPR